MAHLPRGTVTFLFTDIEGSTRLWERDASLMWAALARHNAILDAAITANHGVHFKTIGDAYQAAFSEPTDALRACVDAQRGLDHAEWPETGPIRVRMALHLGAAEPTDGDYLAPCLNRLSRLLSTGYGAQVLLSDVVRERVEEHLPDGVTLRDMGMHRLRDLLEPEHVAQLVIVGLPDTFPPLKSLEAHPTNLPIQPNPMVGRERELATITGLLSDGDDRLVTLTGIGGTGKTRLALQAGAELVDAFFDGVFFVDLAPVSGEGLVVPTIAATLGVRETGGLSLDEALVAYLSGRHLLLIVDNLEQLPGAPRHLARLLEQCAGIRILATSRTRLRIRAEREIRVEPLALPTATMATEEIARNDAVMLFMQRATAASPGFALTDETAPIVAEICARLDGIPLAIELAASRVRTLSPRALLQRLDRRLEVLTTGADDLPARQRTLRATIEWSHSLLRGEHRRCFDRLAVFNGGFDLDAAIAVAGPTSESMLDILTALYDRSLIRRAADGEDAPRFTMLETLREFGLEQLRQDGELEATRDAHAAWSLQLAQTAREKLIGPEQAVWLERLEREHDNMRAALSWTDTPAYLDDHIALVAALARFWLIRGHFTEGRRWTDEVLETVGWEITSLPLLQIANESGSFVFALGQFEASRVRYERALAGARGAGNREMEASLCNNLGNAWIRLSKPAEATAWFERSLAISTELNDDFRRAIALGNLGTVAHYRSDMEGALRRYAECIALWRQLGNTHGEVPMLLNLLYLFAPQPAYADRARAYGDQCLDLARKLGDRWDEALVFMGLGQIEDAQGNLDGALDQFRHSLQLLRELGANDGIAANLGYIGVVSLDKGDVDRGIAILFDKLAEDLAAPDTDGVQFNLEGLAVAALIRQNPRLAALALGAAERLRESIDYPLPFTCRMRHERSLTQLQAELGDALDAIWAEGRERPVKDVIAELKQALDPNAKPAPADPREKLLADLDALIGIPEQRPSAPAPGA